MLAYVHSGEAIPGSIFRFRIMQKRATPGLQTPESIGPIWHKKAVFKTDTHVLVLPCAPSNVILGVCFRNNSGCIIYAPGL